MQAAYYFLGVQNKTELSFLILLRLLCVPRVLLEKVSLAVSVGLFIFSTMSSSTVNRWLRPEVYPLFAAVGVAVGICGMQLLRNICINPEVRVTKENRAAGVLDNFEEGKKYTEHGLRKFVRNKSPQIMPSINGFFSDPN